MENPLTRNRRSTTMPMLGKAAAALLLIALPALAQQPLPDAPLPASQSKPPNQSKPEDKGSADQKPNADQKAQTTPEGTSNDRLFYALPNFLTVQTAKLPPLTAGQKFKVVARGSFDYVEYVWYGALSGISQAENSEPGYGQGAAGYGKRYGAAFADGTIENFLTGAVLPSLLRQDPRFYELGRGSFWHRTRYAISRIFITPTDSGRQQFNFSEIVGSAMSAGISTYTYHPRGDRNVSNALSVWGTQIGYDTITIVVKEFWPDIRRKISHKHQLDPPTP